MIIFKVFLLIISAVVNSSLPTVPPTLPKGITLANLLSGTVLAGKDLSLIFSASKDGWSAQKFHQCCDYNPPLPTLVFLRSKSGLVSGCFNPLGWQSRDDYRDSLRTFIFRISPSAGIEKANKIGGSEAAVYDFGDRAIWLAEALFVPLNEKYLGVRRARSELGSSYSKLADGSRSLFRSNADTELTDVECWVASDSLVQSKRVFDEGSSTADMKKSAGVFSAMKKFESFLFGND